MGDGAPAGEGLTLKVVADVCVCVCVCVCVGGVVPSCTNCSVPEAGSLGKAAHL